MQIPKDKNNGLLHYYYPLYAQKGSKVVLVLTNPFNIIIPFRCQFNDSDPFISSFGHLRVNRSQIRRIRKAITLTIS